METEYKMEIEYMTTEELENRVAGYMKKAKLKDKKWMYNYFSGHDEWPIITDEIEVTHESTIHLR